MTPDQLWRTWKIINELRAYLSNHYEAGAEGIRKDLNEATKVMKMLTSERRKILNKKQK